MRTGKNHLRRFYATGAAAILFAAATLWASAPPTSGVGGKRAPKDKPSAGAAKQIRVDLDKAVAVELPEMRRDLKPVAFRTKDGKTGWAVRIPGERPIATPAYANGLVFVGGGYGSHEFYAFNARTGALAWKINTGDDGPTAAVVEDGLVAFNTESCTLVVVNAQTGKVVWQEWLGDPLMSQPAISKGKVFIAYPAGQRDEQKRRTKKRTKQHEDEDNETGSHRLLAANLRTGKHIWSRAISGDVISAPVIDGERVYFTCFDGTSYALDARDGRVIWKKENAGTSAPVVAAGQVVITQKETRGRDSYEGVKILNSARGEDKDKRLLAREKAGYLDENKGGGVALKAETQAALDSSVGFGTAPEAAQLGEANKHVGVSTVAGGWAYQGSRAAYSRGQMINAQGRYINSIKASDGEHSWRAEVSGRDVAEDTQVFSPPSLGDRFMYLSGALGHLLSVRQTDGEVGFIYALGHPLVFQPALAEGNVYVGTADGLVVCLKTGSMDADGWYAWGGNAQHNKNK